MRIVAPLIAPAIAASFLWVFTHSLREFSIALMLRSGSNEVLSTILYSYWENGKPEIAAAMAIMLMLGLGALIAVGQMWTRRAPAA
jgi:ABC-type Fe3+ transport system permease subunit